MQAGAKVLISSGGAVDERTASLAITKFFNTLKEDGATIGAALAAANDVIDDHNMHVDSHRQMEHGSGVSATSTFADIMKE